MVEILNRFLSAVASYWQILVGTSIVALLLASGRFLIRWYHLSPNFTLAFRGPERYETTSTWGGLTAIPTLNLRVENMGGKILSSSARTVRLEVRLRDGASGNVHPYFPVIWEWRNQEPVVEIPEISAGTRYDVRLFEYHPGTQSTHVMNPVSSRVQDGEYMLEVILTCREYRRPLIARFGRLRVPEDFVSVL